MTDAQVKALEIRALEMLELHSGYMQLDSFRARCPAMVENRIREQELVRDLASNSGNLYLVWTPAGRKALEEARR